jgi:hypothetical protein
MSSAARVYKRGVFTLQRCGFVTVMFTPPMVEDDSAIAVVASAVEDVR